MGKKIFAEISKKYFGVEPVLVQGGPVLVQGGPFLVHSRVSSTVLNILLVFSGTKTKVSCLNVKKLWTLKQINKCPILVVTLNLYLAQESIFHLCFSHLLFHFFFDHPVYFGHSKNSLKCQTEVYPAIVDCKSLWKCFLTSQNKGGQIINSLYLVFDRLQINIISTSLAGSKWWYWLHQSIFGPWIASTHTTLCSNYTKLFSLFITCYTKNWDR